MHADELLLLHDEERIALGGELYDVDVHRDLERLCPLPRLLRTTEERLCVLLPKTQRRGESCRRQSSSGSPISLHEGSRYSDL